MIYSLTWLPEVLIAAGLKVAQTTDWQSRGRGEMGTVRGVMCHHTANPAPGNMPSLQLLIAGRPDLSGPLAQLGLGRDGTYYVVAAGRANHAGAGQWEGITTGNSSFIGIEAENDGVGEPWPPVQMEAYQRGAAAILKKLGAGANMCCGHKEYAEPPGRKSDPSFDMPAFRRAVAGFLAGATPTPLIPATDALQRPTLRQGGKGPSVTEAQRLLGTASDGFFGPNTEAALRAFQRAKGLVPDGILGPNTWDALSQSGGNPAGSAAPSAPAPAIPAAPAPAIPAAQAPASPAAPALVIPAAPAPAPLPIADTADKQPTLVGRKALGPDGKQFATPSGAGFYTIGETTIAAWLDGGQSLPANISNSVRNAVAAMSSVEGGLEAVNSYDNAHLSFGAFQWTSGSANDPGELAALLARFKSSDPVAYQDCFGKYGLDPQVSNASATTGFLSLNGSLLKTSDQKEALRQIVWAYRFWRAGHQQSLRLCQFLFAASRINRFIDMDVGGKPLRQWMSSELAVALILDEHVNRPGHVPKTLLDAIKSLGVGKADLSTWTDQQEHQLIDAYLLKREATNMTDSRRRATKIESYVSVSKLSDKRGSFTL